jgi:hypothetical protein
MVLNMLVAKLRNEDGLCLKVVEERDINIENVLRADMLIVDAKIVDVHVVEKDVKKEVPKSPCAKKVAF